uniref:Uncharacterized protein n=1 Tax=Myoviridae sp. ctqfO1 TaxID=2827710 RepID=A0A8S5T372_9CAUD|nr:MAG TPA: hypothetical protein [Myoviridae sp. ctqfO1]
MCPILWLMSYRDTYVLFFLPIHFLNTPFLGKSFLCLF